MNIDPADQVDYVVFYSCHCQYTQSGYKTGKLALLLEKANICLQKS